MSAWPRLQQRSAPLNNGGHKLVWAIFPFVSASTNKTFEGKIWGLTSVLKPYTVSISQGLE